MHCRLALGIVAVLVAACGTGAPSAPNVSLASPAAPPPTSLAASPVLVAGLQVGCGDGLDPAECSARQGAALDAVAGSGHVPTHVWLSSGVLCPMVDDCLFNPNANFPAPTLPGDSPAPDGSLHMASGSAEIAFADTDMHAGINFFESGTRLVPSLIGYRVPDRAWCSGECPTAMAGEGDFRLELVLPHLDWRVGEPIVAADAILEYRGSSPTNVYGARDIISFGYAEVGGKRSFGPGFDASCQATAIDPATPLNVPLGKTGGYDPNSPNDAWVVPFLNANGVQLPAGTWDVTAESVFIEGQGCSGAQHDLRATLRVTVGG